MTSEPDYILTSLKAVLGEEVIDDKQGFADLGSPALLPHNGAASW